jgi:hypothetical protein
MGSNNTANGSSALYSNTMGNSNTAAGANALESNAMGSNNTANGFNALYSSTGSNNIALGYAAGAYHMTGNDNIFIGPMGMSNEAAHIRIGTLGLQSGTFIAGISNVAVMGIPVAVGPGGKLGVITSSARFKEAIKPMGQSERSDPSVKASHVPL